MSCADSVPGRLSVIARSQRSQSSCPFLMIRTSRELAVGRRGSASKTLADCFRPQYCFYTGLGEDITK